MQENDSIRLLKECDAGTKMAVSSIDEVLESIRDPELKDILKASKERHEKIKDMIHEELSHFDASEKDPNPIAKSMSWLKTNMKMSHDNSERTVSDLITDGCHMGIKSLNQYMNQYPAAEEKIKAICLLLIKAEDELEKELRPYL